MKAATIDSGINIFFTETGHGLWAIGRESSDSIAQSQPQLANFG